MQRVDDEVEVTAAGVVKADAGAEGVGEPAAGDQGPPVSWPPPGLARLQGDAYSAAAWLAATSFLILPLLWAVVADQGDWSLGPLGESLWVAYVLAIVGIPILLSGFAVLLRLLKRTSEAVSRGYDVRLVGLVAADRRRDTGFLLQGARIYASLRDAGRARLVRNRVTVAALTLGAAAWPPFGFGLAVVLGARGVLGPTSVALLTLGPSVVAATLALLANAWEEGVLRRARKRWHRRSWREELTREEIRGWGAAMGARLPERLGGLTGPGSERARLAVRGSRIAVTGLAAVALVPIFTLVLSAALVPVLARIASPRVNVAQARYAGLEPLRRYALPADPSITAAEAGATLHALTFVGRPYRANEGVRPPVAAYPDPWFPAAAQPGDAPSAGDAAIAPGPVEDAVDALGRPLDAATAAYLRQVAANPAHAAVARVARAGAMDLAGARWAMPLPSGITMATLSLPRLQPIREAGMAHLAAAALAAGSGQTARADTLVREVLGMGLLLADHGPTLLDNLVGVVVATQAADALETLYRNTGHPDAGALTWMRLAADRIARRVEPGLGDGPIGRFEAMPAVALDSAALRGLRWEYVGFLNTLGPCVNLRRIVFGPGPEYHAWLSGVKAGLVRWPSEKELFHVAEGGLLRHGMGEPPGFGTRLLALTMGGAGESGSCAEAFSGLLRF